MAGEAPSAFGPLLPPPAQLRPRMPLAAGSDRTAADNSHRNKTSSRRKPHFILFPSFSAFSRTDHPQASSERARRREMAALQWHPSPARARSRSCTRHRRVAPPWRSFQAARFLMRRRRARAWPLFAGALRAGTALGQAMRRHGSLLLPSASSRSSPTTSS